MERLISLLGLGVFVGLSYAFSVHRQAVRWRLVAIGIGLQFIFGILILKFPLGLRIFQALGDGVSQFLSFSDQGANFVFGEDLLKTYFVFAFKVLPTVIFFSSFITILYHYGILQRIVQAIAKLMQRTMQTSGSETLSAASNIFVGQTEAPLLVKPYVATMTKSELHAVMTGGFATIAGGVMAAYISFGIPAEHLIAASVMSAPAALAISKLLYPETEESPTAGDVKLETPKVYSNALDAAATGASDGMKLALNIAAMLIAFLGLLALVNAVVSGLGGLVGFPELTVEQILAWLLAPVAWLMGVPWSEAGQVGMLLGKKTILNEFIAYLDLSELVKNSQISERAEIIATYALCGFSNIGSIGIQIGGIGAMAPERQADLAQLGVRAMIAGSIACFMTACIAGLLI